MAIHGVGGKQGRRKGSAGADLRPRSFRGQVERPPIMQNPCVDPLFPPTRGEWQCMRCERTVQNSSFLEAAVRLAPPCLSHPNARRKILITYNMDGTLKHRIVCVYGNEHVLTDCPWLPVEVYLGLQIVCLMSKRIKQRIINRDDPQHACPSMCAGSGVSWSPRGLSLSLTVGDEARKPSGRAISEGHLFGAKGNGIASSRTPTPKK